MSNPLIQGLSCLVLFMALQGITLQDAQAGRSLRVRAPTKTIAAVKTRRALHPSSHRPAARRLRSGQTLHPARKATRVSLKNNARAARPRLATTKAISKTRATRRLKAAKPSATRSRVITKPSKTKAFAKAVKARVLRLKQTPLVRSIARRFTKIAAATTRRLDSWQARAPPWLAKSIKTLRTYSLPGLAAYSLTRLKSDPKFLGTYFAANSIVSYGVLPAAVSLGLNPVTSAFLNALSTPMTLGVLIFRDRQLKRRAGEEVTLAQSAKSVLHEYREFAKTRLAKTSARAQALAMK